MKTMIITILILASINNICLSQSKAEVLSFENLFEPDKKHQHRKLAKTNNEIKFIFSSLYFSYKHFISPQDLSTCVFSPSCSTYSIRAIRKHGFIIGIMESFDRLTRCNPLSPENYEINPRTNKFIDPVQ